MTEKWCDCGLYPNKLCPTPKECQDLEYEEIEGFDLEDQLDILLGDG